VRVPATAILGQLDTGLAVAQTFVHENRIRQAASSCGAAKFCIEKSIERAKSRQIWGEGRTLADHQAIQFPIVELMTQVEMLRLLIFADGGGDGLRLLQSVTVYNEGLSSSTSSSLPLSATPKPKRG